MRLLILLCVLSSLFTSCSNSPKRDEGQRSVQSTGSPQEEAAPSASKLSGHELSLTYCGGCHAYVSPALLPKAVWKSDVLPAMGHRLGIYPEGYRPNNLFDPGIGGTIVRRANIFPERPVIAEEDWRKITEYFVVNAPDTIPPPIRKSKIRMNLKHFKYKEASFSHRPPLTAMVKILPDNRGIAFSDGKGRRSVLTFLTTDLHENYSIPLRSTPVQFHEKSNELYLTTIGKGIFPNDAPDGTLQRLARKWPDPQYKPANTILGDLQRPVCMAYGNINEDSLEDIVVCEFGNRTGRLSWFDNNGKGGYTKRVLREKPRQRPLRGGKYTAT